MNTHSTNFIDEVKHTCVCPHCLHPLTIKNHAFYCTGCAGTYPIHQTIPDFLAERSNENTMVEDKTPEDKTIHRLSSLYDRASEQYNGSPKSCGYATDASFRHRLNIFKQWIDFSTVKNLKILDIGCGTGLMSETLVAHNEVWGVDISARLLEIARDKGIRTIRSSADGLPFKTGEFHLVICMGVLPYYTHPEHILSQIARVTRPNGRILITSTTNSLLIRSVRCLKNLSWKKSQLKRLYTPLDLEMAMIDTGIRVLDTCVGYKDQITSCKHTPPPTKFRLLARVAAALGTLPEK